MLWIRWREASTLLTFGRVPGQRAGPKSWLQKINWKNSLNFWPAKTSGLTNWKERFKSKFLGTIGLLTQSNYFFFLNSLIELSAGQKGASLRVGSPRYTLDWDDYYSHEVINEFIDELADSYPDVTTVSIGQTFEGRDMRVIQVNRAGPDAPNIWIEAGIGHWGGLSLKILNIV